MSKYGNSPQTLSRTHTSIWPLWKNWHDIGDSKYFTVLYEILIPEYLFPSL